MDVERRVAALESQVRTWRWVVVVLSGVVAVLLVGGSGIPSWVLLALAVAPIGMTIAKQANDVVRASRFEVVDESGAVRAALGLDATGPSLALYDTRSRPAALLQVSPGGTDLVLCDRDGTLRTQLQAHQDGPFLALYDKQEQVRVGLAVPASGPSLDLYDRNGESRAAVFAPEGDPSGVVIRDSEGNQVFFRPNSGGASPS